MIGIENAGASRLGFDGEAIIPTGALLHKRVQDVLGSGQIFWNNGLTHSRIHPASLCIPLSPFQAHMHAQRRQQNFDLLNRSLKAPWFSRFCLPATLQNSSHFDMYLNACRSQREHFCCLSNVSRR